MGLNWQYKGQDFNDEQVGNYFGFVYIITNLVDGKQYIGKKLFYTTKTKRLKGKKKRFRVPSGWQTYYGSSAKLSEDVLQLGMEKFSREILHLCKSRGGCSYLEAKEQFCSGALESDKYYNTWIMVRVRKSHIKELNHA